MVSVCPELVVSAVWLVVSVCSVLSGRLPSVAEMSILVSVGAGVEVATSTFVGRPPIHLSCTLNTFCNLSALSCAADWVVAPVVDDLACLIG